MKILAPLLSLFLWTGTSFGQTGINIDFGSAGTAPLPEYAAAGTQGIWNNVTSLTSTPLAGMLDLSGNATAVLISSSRPLVPVTPSSQPFSGNDAKLLGDYLVSFQNDFILTLRGLEPSAYRVFTYTVGRQDFPRSSTVTPFGSPPLTATNTGIWAGLLEHGVTHSIHDMQLLSGDLTLHFFSSADGFVSGIQIISIPEPSSLVAIAAIVAISQKRSRLVR